MRQGDTLFQCLTLRTLDRFYFWKFKVLMEILHRQKESDWLKCSIERTTKIPSSFCCQHGRLSWYLLLCFRRWYPFVILNMIIPLYIAEGISRDGPNSLCQVAIFKLYLGSLIPIFKFLKPWFETHLHSKIIFSEFSLHSGSLISEKISHWN